MGITKEDIKVSGMIKDPKLRELENNQKKIIQQNKQIISLLERININLIDKSQKSLNRR